MHDSYVMTHAFVINGFSTRCNGMYTCEVHGSILCPILCPIGQCSIHMVVRTPHYNGVSCRNYLMLCNICISGTPYRVNYN